MTPSSSMKNSSSNASGISLSLIHIFYELKEDWWKKWASMGVMAVEMEAAALYMNAAYNDVNALAVMTISDHFVTGEKATAEERQNSFTDMMKLALEAAIK